MEGIGEVLVVWFKWFTVASLMAGGFLGTFLPILPGSIFILFGAVAHYFFFGMEQSGLSWVILVVLGLLFALSMLVDWLSGAMGAKWFGSSKWGIAGVLIGGIIGFFFGFVGIIVGPLIGAFVFEMIFAKKELDSAAKSTWGTLIGGGAGMVAKGLISLVMIGCYITDAFIVN